MSERVPPAIFKYGEEPEEVDPPTSQPEISFSSGIIFQLGRLDRKTDMPEPPPQAVFLHAPEISGMNKLHGARGEARYNFRRLIEKISKKPADSQQGVALADFIEVLEAERRREELALKVTSGQMDNDLLTQAKKQVERATQKQIRHGERYKLLAGKSDNSYNRTIVDLSWLGNRLERVERKILSYPYIVIMGAAFEGTKTAQEKQTHPDFPTSEQINLRATITVANRVSRIVQQYVPQAVRPA